MKTLEEVEKIFDEAGIKYGYWCMGDMKRLYINNPGRLYDRLIGLEKRFYNSGNLAQAWLNGEPISNAEAGRLSLQKAGSYYSSKLWYDINTGEFKSKNYKQEQINQVINYLNDLIK